MDKYFIIEHLLSGYALYVLQGLPPHQNTVGKIVLNDKYNIFDCVRISMSMFNEALGLKEYRAKHG